MKYPKVPLRELCESIDYGYTASATEEPVGPRFLRITDIVQSHLNWSKVPFCFIQERYKAKHKLRAGDIVIARTGATTGWAKYVQDPPDAVFASYLVRIRLAKSVDARFIGQVIESQIYKDFIKQNIGGSAQPNANAKVLTSFPAPVPPKKIQSQISGILSCYDDLIENNTRRIKILEQMAQTIYREWFVNFRFPSYERTGFLDSPKGKFPVGWEAARLGDHLESLEAGKRPKGGIRDEVDGVPSIGAENIRGIGRHDFASEKYVSKEYFVNMNKGVVRDRDVAIYKDGAYIGKSSYFRDGFPYAKCCVNEHVFLLRSSGRRLKQNFLYLWLQQPETVQTIRSTNANAAQPGINQSCVYGLEIVLPDADIADQFDKLVEPILASIINLAKINRNLRNTRDLLLPKLISGELDVSELDIQTPETNG